ncbi:MAG: hypothetical protein WAK96_02945 [Desulfobaccales bacterium]
MMFWNKERFMAAILLVLFAFPLCGCAGVETGQDRVVTEYLLREAGFAKLEVNDTTPARQALMTAIPKGQFTTYNLDGKKYYVYKDEPSRALYFGDEAAYRKFASLVSDKRLCQSMDATQSAPFWSCFQEFQKAGKQ